MQHDEAAMRRQQAAGPDTGEIRHQDFIVRLVFDAAEQGAEHRVVLNDHGRAVHAKVVHDQIDMKARQYAAKRLQSGLLVVFGNLKHSQVVQYVMRGLFQIGIELDRILDLLLQAHADFLHRMIQQRLDKLALQRRQSLIHDALQRLHFVHETGNLGAQFQFRLVNRGATFLRQGNGFTFRIGAAFFITQGENKSPRLAVKGEAARFRKGIQLCVGAGLLGAVGFLDPLAVCLEILPVQTLRNF